MNLRTVHHKVKITVLTPVHVGSGEYYTPVNSYIHENTYKKDDFSMRMFSPKKLSKLMSSDKKFKKKFDDIFSVEYPDLGKLYRLFNGNWHKLAGGADLQVKIGSSIQSFIKPRMEKGNSKGGKYLLNIERNFHNPTNENVLIPGSSLKGSIRTALLNGALDDKTKTKLKGEVLKGSELNKREIRLSELNVVSQKEAFKYDGNVINDPLKQLSIGDTFSVPNKGACEVMFKRTFQKQSQNCGKGGGGLKGLLECLTAGTEFFSNLSFNRVAECAYFPSFQNVKEACHEFYSPIFEHELDILKKESGWSSVNCENIRTTRLGVGSEPAEGFLLRVGRYSGAESMTIDNLREIEIRLKEGENKQPKRNTSWEDQTKTLSLASTREKEWADADPFGWVWVEEVHE